MSADMVVSGEIVFDNPPPMGEATVYVRLEDVSLLDAPAKLVAEQVLRDVELGDGAPLAFILRGARPPHNARLNISVHVSLSGRSDIQRGDYITMQSYPITNPERPDPVRVMVRRL